MIQRRGKPSFSKEDEERLLAFMHVTRELNIRYGAASDFHSLQHDFSEALKIAIDKLGEHITGVPRIFLPDDYGIGRPSEATTPKQIRALLWKELRVKYR